MRDYDKRIPLEKEVISLLADCINEGHSDHRFYMATEKFLTDNGGDMNIWNYINKSIAGRMPDNLFQIAVFTRNRWQFIGIYDKRTKYLYTLMRAKNFEILRKQTEKKKRHYLNGLSLFNKDLRGNYYLKGQQLSFLESDPFSEEEVVTLEELCANFTANVDGEIKQHVLVTFKTEHGSVTSMFAYLLDIGFNYYHYENWSDYIGATYAFDMAGTIETDEESKETSVDTPILLKRKRKNKSIM